MKRMFLSQKSMRAIRRAESVAHSKLKKSGKPGVVSTFNAGDTTYTTARIQTSTPVLTKRAKTPTKRTRSSRVCLHFSGKVVA